MFLKTLLLVFSVFSLSLSAADPAIFFTFDRGIRADAGGTGAHAPEVAGQNEPTGVQGILSEKAADRTPDKMLAPGLSGKALLVGRSSDGKGIQTICYHPRPAQNSAEGTISFWVKPVDWNGTDKEFHHFFGAANEANRLIVYKYHNSPNLIFLYGRLAKDGFQTTVSTDIGKWKAGEWHHICASWDQKKMELFIDGRLSSIAEVKKPVDGGFMKFILGEYWQGNPGNSAIDELRIFEKKLSSKEIEAEYERFASKVPCTSSPLEFTVGKRTPVIDGIIHEHEYAFGASGMHSISNIVYSPSQSQCFFSWDRDNLYVGMRTPGTDIVSRHSGRDGALWEDDSIELWLYGLHGKKDVFQFIFNSRGVFYDSFQGNKDWNASEVRTANSVQGNLWTFEAAVPWANFKLDPVAGTRFRINLCRSLMAAADWTSFSPGKYGSVSNYAQMTLNPDAPVLEITQYGPLYDGKIDCTIKLLPSVKDTVTVDVAATATLFPFDFHKKLELLPGQAVQEIIRGNVPRNRILEADIHSEKVGTLYRASIDYKEVSPVKIGYIYTDIPSQKLFLVFRNTRLGAGKNRLEFSLSDKTGKVVLSGKQIISDTALTVPCGFDIRSVPCGEYTLAYEVFSSGGKLLMKDNEPYGKFPEKPSWADTAAGNEDSIPPPWTPIRADDAAFSCWGRTYRFGGKGISESLVSQSRELLSGPLSLKWNGKQVAFRSKIVGKKNSCVDYRLLPVDKSIPLELDIRAEFDGVLWCAVRLKTDAKTTVEKLELEIPLKREYVTGFDDCSSIRYKKDLTAMKEGQFSNDPVNNPFFWCGGDDVGMMGGSQSRRGWYLRDKKNGMMVDVRPDEVVLNMKFIDSPLQLTQGRKLEFYLQPTPVKPKNAAAGRVRPGVNAITWTGYVTCFFEHKRPGCFLETKLKDFRDRQEKHGDLVFYYNGMKGVSPLTAEWNYFGKLWHNPEPKLGNYMLDSVVKDKTERNHSTWTYGCLNCKSFFDYKLDSITRFIENLDYRVMNLYFDLTWPRTCSNENHGCSWRDEFGYMHRDNDLIRLRECLLRIYRVLKKKNPDGFFIGHLIASRTPSDVFFDLLLVGEAYDRDIVKNGNYYGVFNPEMMRIAYSSRSNETTIFMLPQFYRALQLFAPAKLKDFNPAAPETDRAIRHYLGYLLVHNLSSTPPWKRMKDVYAAQDRLGWNEKTVFYPYWHPAECPVKFVTPKPHLLASAYANGGKTLLVVLNDSDDREKGSLRVDTLKLGFKDGSSGMDMFSGKKYSVTNGLISLELEPRGAALISLD